MSRIMQWKVGTYLKMLCKLGLVTVFGGAVLSGMGCGNGLLPVLVGTGAFVAGASSGNQNDDGGQDGLPGDDGSSGENGLPGANGTNGIDGTNGLDGEPGLNGSDGLPGIDGAIGPTGADGVPGADGASPEDCWVICPASFRQPCEIVCPESVESATRLTPADMVPK